MPEVQGWPPGRAAEPLWVSRTLRTLGLKQGTGVLSFRYLFQSRGGCPGNTLGRKGVPPVLVATSKTAIQSSSHRNRIEVRTALRL